MSPVPEAWPTPRCPHCGNEVVKGLAYNATYSPTTGEFNPDGGVYCNEAHLYAHRPDVLARAERDAAMSRPWQEPAR